MRSFSIVGNDMDNEQTDEEYKSEVWKSESGK